MDTFILLLTLIQVISTSKVVVFSGYQNTRDFVVQTEVLDLTDPTNTCQNLPNFPVEIYGATSGLIEVLNRNGALVCGGTYFLEVEPRCYAIFPDATTVIGMSIHRAYPASVTINKTNLWVTGGLTYGTSLESLYQVLSTTDVIDAQYKTHTPGPELPQKLFGHCALSINQQEVMMVGGYQGDTIWEAKSTSTTHIYHFENGWRKGPNMNAARADLACSIFTSQSNQYVVVTGGVNDRGYLSSTELFSLVDNQWLSGPNLPLKLAAHSMVSLLTKVYVIGGLTPGSGPLGVSQSKIYAMDQAMDQWMVLEQKLSVARYYFTALTVPDSMVSCTQK